MKSIKELLKINGKETTEAIKKHICDAVNKHKVNGVIMGVSGGIDSALLIALSVQALGKEKVHAYFLHDKNSEKDSEDKARLMTEWLGLKLNVGSIANAMREKEKKALFFKCMAALPSFAPPIIASIYYIIVGETPYMTTLRQNELKKDRFKKWIYEHIMDGVEKMFDGPCEERRIVLEKIAKKENLLLIGAGNRSEDLTGWFTIKGVDNMPVSPIAGLYKTQVRQLSEHLGIPAVIQKRESSPDVLRGVNDTLALGMDFDKIDAVLYGIENTFSDEDIMVYGLTEKEIIKVRDIHKLSAWKREM